MLDLSKLFADAGLILRRYTNSGVLDRDSNHFTVAGFGPNTDLSLFRELKRVRDKVAKNLDNFTLIAVDGRHGRCILEMQLYSFRIHQRTKQTTESAKYQLQPELRWIDRDFARFHLG